MPDSHHRPLRIGSVMADNYTHVMRQLVIQLNAADINAEWVDEPWQQQQQMLDDNTLDLAPLCGLGYVRRTNAGHNLQLVAVPVPAGERYDNQPVYFSQVLVPTDSPHTTLTDLHNTRFATNEPGSHSGYTLIRAHLHTLGLPQHFFAEEVITGSHAATLQHLADGRVDAGLVDTTVLEHQTEHDPDSFRPITTLGPSAFPPVVANPNVGPQLLAAVTDVLCRMHTTDTGRTTLQASNFRRFTTADPAMYADIQQVADLAADIELAPAVTSLADISHCHTS